MKALRIEEYGGSEVMAYADVPLPTVGPDDVLIEIEAAAVNPIDWKIREGILKAHLPIPLPHVLGRDFAGRVAATGENVRSIACGDAVYGTAEALRFGSHAEFVAVNANNVGLRPERLDPAEAASIPLAALSALAMMDASRLAAGERVLIHAGAGGVGSLAIQMAKAIGAEVATTAGAASLDYVRGLGADLAIDYANTDFATQWKDGDVVFDTMGGEIHKRSLSVLKPGGRLAYLIAAPLGDAPVRKDVEIVHAVVDYGKAALSRVTAMVEAGRLAPQVETVTPMAEAAKAYDLSQSGHARGKIILAP